MFARCINTALLNESAKDLDAFWTCETGIYHSESWSVSFANRPHWFDWKAQPVLQFSHSVKHSLPQTIHNGRPRVHQSVRGIRESEFLIARSLSLSLSPFPDLSLYLIERGAFWWELVVNTSSRRSLGKAARPRGGRFHLMLRCLMSLSVIG